MNVDIIQTKMAVDGLEARAEANRAGARKLDALREARRELKAALEKSESSVEDLEARIEKEANRKWYDPKRWFSNRGERLAQTAAREQVEIERNEDELEQARSEQKTEFDEILAADDEARGVVRFVEDMQNNLRSRSTGLA